VHGWCADHITAQLRQHNDWITNPFAHMSSKILVVEDQEDIAELVQMHLQDLGYSVDIAPDGIDGLRRAPDYDLLVLDGMLPGKDGLEVLRSLRTSGVNLPVLMLTARAAEIDRVVGLEMGADDYLSKPFSIPELQARVKALLRRAANNLAPAASSSQGGTEVIAQGQLKIDVNAHEAWFANRPLSLTSKEFDLLLHFARHPGRVFSRVQLLEAVWGTTYEGYELAVNTHINRLRAKVEVDPANPRMIQTVRGVGYRFQSASSQ
jgi:DNA-binding response OmpR family regulator